MFSTKRCTRRNVSWIRSCLRPIVVSAKLFSPNCLTPAQGNLFIDMVLLGNHSVCFGREIRKNSYWLHPPIHQFDQEVWVPKRNRLIETVLFNTHNICFGREIRKLVIGYTPRIHQFEQIVFVPKGTVSFRRFF